MSLGFKGLGFTVRESNVSYDNPKDPGTQIVHWTQSNPKKRTLVPKHILLGHLDPYVISKLYNISRLFTTDPDYCILLCTIDPYYRKTRYDMGSAKTPKH